MIISDGHVFRFIDYFHIENRQRHFQLKPLKYCFAGDAMIEAEFSHEFHVRKRHKERLMPPEISDCIGSISRQ